jgi:hypothetical protein
MEEEFRIIENFPHHRISNLGRVQTRKIRGAKTYISDEWLDMSFATEKGYKFLTISHENKKFRFYVHRLVAIYWVPNPKNYARVRCKNNDRTDIRIENLEWHNIHPSKAIPHKPKFE